MFCLSCLCGCMAYCKYLIFVQPSNVLVSNWLIEYCSQSLMEWESLTYNCGKNLGEPLGIWLLKWEAGQRHFQKVICLCVERSCSTNFNQFMMTPEGGLLFGPEPQVARPPLDRSPVMMTAMNPLSTICQLHGCVIITRLLSCRET